MADVFDAELEHAIALDPDDPALFAVYADWLQQAGSARGELAAVQLAREAGDDQKLAAREAELLDEHAAIVRGPAQADGYRIEDHCNEVTYRGGFWRAITFSGPLRVLQALVAHPSARLLHSLAVGYLDGTTDDYAPAVAAIAAAHLPVLRVLRLGDVPEGQSALAGFGDRTCGSLAALAAACPRLETLRLLCPRFELGAHPTLRTLDARLGATPDSVARLADAQLPALAALDLGFETLEDAMYPELRWSLTTLDPVPGSRALTVRLWPMPPEGDLAERLVERGAARFAGVEICEDLDADDTGGAYAM